MVASFIVVLAALANEHNQVIHWPVVGTNLVAGLSIMFASAIALRLANRFKLAWVSAGGPTPRCRTALSTTS